MREGGGERRRRRGKGGHRPGLWDRKLRGPSRSGRKGQARLPRAVQHQSPEGVRTALPTLSHSGHCPRRQEVSAENRAPPHQLSQAPTSLPPPSPRSLRKEVLGGIWAAETREHPLPLGTGHLVTYTWTRHKCHVPACGAQARRVGSRLRSTSGGGFPGKRSEMEVSIPGTFRGDSWEQHLQVGRRQDGAGAE